MTYLVRSIQRNIMLPGGKLQKKTIEVARYILEIYLQAHTFFLHLCRITSHLLTASRISPLLKAQCIEHATYVKKKYPLPKSPSTTPYASTGNAPRLPPASASSPCRACLPKRITGKSSAPNALPPSKGNAPSTAPVRRRVTPKAS